MRKIHKSDRKTKIIAAEGEFQMEDLIADEQVVITISKDDYIKTDADRYRSASRDAAGWRHWHGDEKRGRYA